MNGGMVIARIVATEIAMATARITIEYLPITMRGRSSKKHILCVKFRSYLI